MGAGLAPDYCGGPVRPNGQVARVTAGARCYGTNPSPRGMARSSARLVVSCGQVADVAQERLSGHGDACPKVPGNAALSGAPGRSRTCGPRLRRPLLYPAELQARGPASAFTPQTRQAASGGAAATAEAGSPSLTPGRARSRTLRFRGQVARGSGWTDAGRGGREAEGAGLLNQYTVQSCIEGSNPSLSATVRRRALSSVG